MIRTQIYLTEEEHSAIGVLSKKLKRRQSDIIRQAVDEYLVRTNPDGKLGQIRKAKGIWKGKKVPDYRKERKAFDRF